MIERDLAYFRLKEEIEELLYEEADLLDQRRFGDWLGMLADDLHYFMPMRRNVAFGTHAEKENTRAGQDISWFDEDKWTLSKRVDQIMTGIHWAEEPLSRLCHIVSNIRLKAARPSVADAEEVEVGSRFLVYQNRVETETYIFVGRRNDMWRRPREDDAAGWRLAKREILLEQNVLMAKNLTTFF
ncbi:MAG TPA: 3-phenylpropionate/cinnamic acid dioxygenase subunit beta [Rhodopila sp.]|jgi:3-phenylpropionate/cinnamic acid dioxygenase small subunit|nr:3-phenylpropionate/cinnamic acid dioxygenase subunit beta [Rhodopila sp.]